MPSNLLQWLLALLMALLAVGSRPVDVFQDGRLIANAEIKAGRVVVNLPAADEVKADPAVASAANLKFQIGAGKGISLTDGSGQTATAQDGCVAQLTSGTDLTGTADVTMIARILAEACTKMRESAPAPTAPVTPTINVAVTVPVSVTAAPAPAITPAPDQRPWRGYWQFQFSDPRCGNEMRVIGREGDTFLGVQEFFSDSLEWKIFQITLESPLTEVYKVYVDTSGFTPRPSLVIYYGIEGRRVAQVFVKELAEMFPQPKYDEAPATQ